MTRMQLVQAIRNKQSFLCVGLDTDIRKIPSFLQDHPDAVFAFNKAIIDATLDLCVSYKINTAFYEAMGGKGWEAMEKTVRYIPESHFRIADAKRGDIGNTSSYYAEAFFKTLPFDAITVAPYMGEDSIRPFFEYAGKWTILLGLTSNPGARDFEWQICGDQPLFEKVMQRAAGWGNPENLMFVVGATQGEALEKIRKELPHHFFLVPGIGAQGGSLEEVSTKAMTGDCGLLVNASRAILYASGEKDFADAARRVAGEYRAEMQHFLSRAGIHP